MKKIGQLPAAYQGCKEWNVLCTIVKAEMGISVLRNIPYLSLRVAAPLKVPPKHLVGSFHVPLSPYSTVLGPLIDELGLVEGSKLGDLKGMSFFADIAYPAYKDLTYPRIVRIVGGSSCTQTYKWQLKSTKKRVYLIPSP